MRIRVLFIIISGLSVFLSSAVSAHHSGSDTSTIARVLHNFSGEHLLMLILVVACAVGVTHLYHRFR